MIVKYIKPRNPLIVDTDPMVSLHKNYLLIGLFNSLVRGLEYYIFADDGGGPIVMKHELFEIVDNQLPQDFVFHLYSNGNMSLEPKEFYEDFWDKYHDADEEAERVFRAAYNRLVDEAREKGYEFDKI